MRHSVLPSPLGEVTCIADDGGLMGVHFERRRYPPAEVGQRVDAADDPLLAQTHHELTAYFAGSLRDFSVPLRPRGDRFSHRVWDLLLQIPYGQTTSYGALATRLGNPRLAQRVGQCVGRNPISIIIPCHRVIGSDGALVGFGGGLPAKRYLLDLEEPEHRRAERLF